MDLSNNTGGSTGFPTPDGTSMYPELPPTTQFPDEVIPLDNFQHDTQVDYTCPGSAPSRDTISVLAQPFTYNPPASDAIMEVVKPTEKPNADSCDITASNKSSKPENPEPIILQNAGFEESRRHEMVNAETTKFPAAVEYERTVITEQDKPGSEFVVSSKTKGKLDPCLSTTMESHYTIVKSTPGNVEMSCPEHVSPVGQRRLVDYYPHPQNQLHTFCPCCYEFENGTPLDMQGLKPLPQPLPDDNVDFSPRMLETFSKFASHIGSRSPNKISWVSKQAHGFCRCCYTFSIHDSTKYNSNKVPFRYSEIIKTQPAPNEAIMSPPNSRPVTKQEFTTEVDDDVVFERIKTIQPTMKSLSGKTELNLQHLPQGSRPIIRSSTPTPICVSPNKYPAKTTHIMEDLEGTEYQHVRSQLHKPTHHSTDDLRTAVDTGPISPIYAPSGCNQRLLDVSSPPETALPCISLAKDLFNANYLETEIHSKSLHTQSPQDFQLELLHPHSTCTQIAGACYTSLLQQMNALKDDGVASDAIKRCLSSVGTTSGIPQVSVGQTEQATSKQMHSKTGKPKRKSAMQVSTISKHRRTGAQASVPPHKTMHSDQNVRKVTAVRNYATQPSPNGSSCSSSEMSNTSRTLRSAVNEISILPQQSLPRSSTSTTTPLANSFPQTLEILLDLFKEGRHHEALQALKDLKNQTRLITATLATQATRAVTLPLAPNNYTSDDSNVPKTVQYPCWLCGHTVQKYEFLHQHFKCYHDLTPRFKKFCLSYTTDKCYVVGCSTKVKSGLTDDEAELFRNNHFVMNHIHANDTPKGLPMGYEQHRPQPERRQRGRKPKNGRAKQ